MNTNKTEMTKKIEPEIKSEIKSTEPVKQAAPHYLYNDRYKYGYDYSCYLKLAQKLIEVMGMTGAKDKETLDVGCGIGWFSDIIFYNLSRKLTAIDFSNIAIDFHAKRLFPSINFKIADIYNFDFKPFEVFVFMEVLEHLEKDIEILTKLPRGGLIYFTVPFENLRNDFTHLREYTEKGITERYGKIMNIKSIFKFDSYFICWGVKK